MFQQFGSPVAEAVQATSHAAKVFIDNESVRLINSITDAIRHIEKLNRAGRVLRSAAQRGDQLAEISFPLAADSLATTARALASMGAMDAGRAVMDIAQDLRPG